MSCGRQNERCSKNRYDPKRLRLRNGRVLSNKAHASEKAVPLKTNDCRDKCEHCCKQGGQFEAPPRRVLAVGPIASAPQLAAPVASSITFLFLLLLLFLPPALFLLFVLLLFFFLASPVLAAPLSLPSPPELSASESPEPSDSESSLPLSLPSPFFFFSPSAAGRLVFGTSTFSSPDDASESDDESSFVFRFGSSHLPHFFF